MDCGEKPPTECSPSSTRNLVCTDPYSTRAPQATKNTRSRNIGTGEAGAREACTIEDTQWKDSNDAQEAILTNQCQQATLCPAPSMVRISFVVVSKACGDDQELWLTLQIVQVDKRRRGI